MLQQVQPGHQARRQAGAPGLGVERAEGDLKAHHLAHQTFKDIDALDQAIHAAVHARNQQRRPHPLAKQRTSA